MARQLGARVINVIGDDAEPARLAASYTALCERAAGHGLSCDIEPMPWAAVPDVAHADRLLRAVAQPNVGVLVDALHWSRAAATLDDVSALPRD